MMGPTSEVFVDERLAAEVQAVLLEACPIACDVAGAAVVEQLSHGRTEFADAHGASKLINHEAIADLIVAVNLILGLFHVRDEIAKLLSSGERKPEVAAKKKRRIAELEERAKNLRPLLRKRVIRTVFPDHEE